MKKTPQGSFPPALDFQFRWLKMDSLPPEIVQQIVTNLPKSSLPSCRLVCRKFDIFVFPILFSHVPNWLDYTISHRAVISLVNDAFNRPAVMWSPWATGPDGPVEEIWMGIVWKLLMKTEPPGTRLSKGKIVSEGTDLVRLTPQNFAELSGREEMSENRLRTSQNRFLLHRSYSDKCDWSGAKL
jgi:F-box-like